MKLELSEKQAEVVLNALNLYSRLALGQVEEIHKTLTDFGEFNPLHEVDTILSQLKDEFFPELGANTFYAIHSDKVSEKAKISYDILQVLRHKLAWDKSPDGGNTVNFYTPCRASEENLPKVES